jgi:hypothetical protein
MKKITTNITRDSYLEERLNVRTMRQLRRAIKDINIGKNLSPVFSTVSEMKKWLEN